MFDEATSNLDTNIEKSIQENIDNLKSHHTMLIVAHRLSTIKNADKIILIWHSLRHHTTISISHTAKQLYSIEKKIVKVIKKIQSASTNLKNFKPKKDHQKSILCYWCPVWNECSAKTGPNPSFQNSIKLLDSNK